MIVESLIQDESKLTLDCAKATLHKGSKVEIEDALYWGPEVQGALKQNMIRIVGKIPDPLPVVHGKPEEAKIKYKNIHTTKVCFECVKDYADPGNFISIPESKIPEREIQNAIAWGMIERVDGPKDAVKTRHNIPVDIDEFTATDAQDENASVLKDMPPAEEKPLDSEEQAIVASRAKPKAQKKKAEKKAEFKPKSISSNAEADDDSGGSELYSETKVVDPTPKPKKQASPPASVLVEGDEPEEQADEQPATGMPRRSKTFGFMDVFGGAQVAAQKPEPDKPAEEGF